MLIRILSFLFPPPVAAEGRGNRITVLELYTHLLPDVVLHRSPDGAITATGSYAGLTGEEWLKRSPVCDSPAFWDLYDPVRDLLVP